VPLRVVVAYIETDLLKRGLAYNTIRDRLVSLGGFWKWMQTRGAVPRDVNPWANHKISKKQNTGTRPAKRAYTSDELVRLLEGNETVRRWPTYSYLPDLAVLGLFTGARIESLAVLRPDNVEQIRGGYMLWVPDQKTKAGARYVAVTHPAPMAVIKRRLGGRKPREHLFSELSPGGLDQKLSSSAVKAYTRYRRACQVPDGTDFHSFRRNVVTVLEQARVGQVEIARFVGHKVGTLGGDTYSEVGRSGDKELALEVGRKVRYPAKVEAAAVAAVRYPA